MEELRRRLGEIADLERAAMLLTWDQEVGMPRAGAPARAEQRATLSRLAHELFCADAIGELLANAEPRDELERDVVRVSQRDYDRARRVPGELVAELSRGAAEGHGAWSEARAGAGFAHFAPALERNLDLARQLSACFDAGEHVYDALVEDYEPGMRTAQVRAVLGALRDGLVPLVAAAGEVDDRVLREGPSAQAGQRALVGTVLRAVGVDAESWRLDDAEHPFQATMAITDVRLTTRFDQDGIEGMFGALHEFGHGLYERQVDPALARTPLATGASSAWHESQSRLWENMVGRSAPFWRWCLPHAAAALPERFGSVERQEVARAAAAVRPTLIRVSADEVTYGLHIALRFELELALLDGTLAVADLPGAWNEKVREYLGIEVPDDAARRAAGRALGRGAVRLLPDLRAGQRDRRAGVGAHRARAAVARRRDRRGRVRRAARVAGGEHPPPRPPPHARGARAGGVRHAAGPRALPRLPRAPRAGISGADALSKQPCLRDRPGAATLGR